jgi:hypothetical protein
MSKSDPGLSDDPTHNLRYPSHPSHSSSSPSVVPSCSRPLTYHASSSDRVIPRSPSFIGTPSTHLVQRLERFTNGARVRHRPGQRRARRHTDAAHVLEEYDFFRLSPVRHLSITGPCGPLQAYRPASTAPRSIIRVTPCSLVPLYNIYDIYINSSLWSVIHSVLTEFLPVVPVSFDGSTRRVRRLHIGRLLSSHHGHRRWLFRHSLPSLTNSTTASGSGY